MAEVANEMTGEAAEGAEAAGSTCDGSEQEEAHYNRLPRVYGSTRHRTRRSSDHTLIGKDPAPVAAPPPGQQPNQVVETPAAAPAPEKKARRKRSDGESVKFL